MELVDGDSESPTLLSNLEVMQLLQKNIEARAKNDATKRNGKAKRPKPLWHRDWIEEQVFQYLETTPCGKLDPMRREEFYSKLRGYKKLKQRTTTTMALKQENSESDEPLSDTKATAATTADASITKSVPTGFNLTEAEALQIMNMMPSQPVEIHLMVDELQSRMSEEEQEEFLDFISSYTKESNDDDRQQPMDTTEDEPPPVAAMYTGNERNTKNGMKDDKEDHGTDNGKAAAAFVKVKEEMDTDETGFI